MTHFNNRGDRDRFGDNRSGRPDFAKKSWGGGRQSDRPLTLYKATCAECGRICEVPFRPVEGKPVYCKDCFGKRGGSAGVERRGDRFPQRDFNTRDSVRPPFENSRSSDTLTKQLEGVNTRLERLIQAVEALALGGRFKTKKEIKDARVTVVKERPKKRAVKK